MDDLHDRTESPDALPTAPRTPFGFPLLVGLTLLLVAAFFPDAFGRFFRGQVVGAPVAGWPGPTHAHQALAILGALLFGLACHHPGGVSLRPLALPPRRLLALAALPFTVLAIMNLIRPLGLRDLLPLHVWRWIGLGSLLTFALVTLVTLLPRFLRELLEPNAGARWLGPGLAAGAGYGCFSALWHCCPPFWFAGPQVACIVVGILTGASLFGVGYMVALTLERPFPRGEFLGGLLLALVYPYHTPLWLLHCWAGGAFAVWLARRTGSLLTPGVAVLSAFLVHMSLPFLGWYGPCVGLALLLLVVLLHDPEVRVHG